MKAELLNPSSTGPRRWDEGWHLVETAWWSEMLVVTQPRQLRSTLIRWNKERVFYSWYTHIQSHLRRTHLGFDKRDFQLDIVVNAERQWHLKDEDELELSVEIGRFTPEQRDAILAEGQQVIGELQSNSGVYAAGWEHWQPSDEIQHPKLPADWDDLSMYAEADGPALWGDDLLP